MWPIVKRVMQALAGRTEVTSALIGPFQHQNQMFAETRPLPGILLRKYVDDVYTCVSMIAQVLSQEARPRLYVEKRRGETIINRTSSVPKHTVARLAKAGRMRYGEDVEEIQEHPLLDMMEDVNPWLTFRELMEIWSIYLDLTGTAYIFVARDAGGTPRELWPLPPDQMRPVTDRKKFISHWLFGFGAQETRFETDEILYSRRVSPLDSIQGYAPLVGILSAADASRAILNFENQLLNNRAVPDLILSVKGQLTTERVQRIRDRWRERFSGRGHGDIAIMSGDDVEVKQIAWKPKDLDYIEAAQRLTKQIANGFGVPISLLQDESANRSIKEAALYQLAKFAVKPRLLRFEQTLNQGLLPMYPGLEGRKDVYLCFDDPVPEDKEFTLKERQVNISLGVVTVNEERTTMGLDPVPWGDEPPAMAAAAALADRQEEQQDEEDDDERQERKERPRKTTKDHRPAHRLLGRNSPKEGELHIAVSSNFQAQRGDILRRISGRDAPWSIKSVMFNRPLYDAQLARSVRQPLREAMHVGVDEGRRLAVLSGNGTGAVGENGDMNAGAKQMAADLATEVNDTTESLITELVQRANAESWTNGQLAAEIENVFA